ncbi:odorant receptor 67d-like [Drosophila sulfurigaster albostrigata]|uniref:odorant receptor 67d-like n=1 Tax=Drosophila sulfurigaster albostrigata TaxID=89887 RepID=UPI002D21DA41|nr:odorant receptor 67d-like [Drosophila sulfurigaster albostrigata]
MSPSESFLQIMRFVRFVKRCLGVDVYDKDYHINIFTAMCVLACFMYGGFTLNTAILERHSIFAFQSLVMSGLLVQGVNKLFVLVYNARDLYELNQSVLKIYLDYENHSDPRFAKNLQENCDRLRRALIVVFISYYIAIGGMIILPLTVNMFTGDNHLIMQFYVPGIDHTTQSGFWLLQVIHVFVLNVGGAGMFAGDLVILVHLIQAYIFRDILRLKIDIFNTFVEEPGKQSDSDIQKGLVDMMQFHQLYLSFIARCNDLFYSIVSVQVISAAGCFILTMFVLLTSVWPGGWAYAVGLASNLYIYCVLGTLVENCNDDLIYEVYNISFYNLNARQQRQVLFMLCKTQSTDMIQLLGVMPLAVSTALQVSYVLN